MSNLYCVILFVIFLTFCLIYSLFAAGGGAPDPGQVPGEERRTQGLVREGTSGTLKKTSSKGTSLKDHT